MSHKITVILPRNEKCHSDSEHTRFTQNYACCWIACGIFVYCRCVPCAATYRWIRETGTVPSYPTLPYTKMN